MNNLGNDKTTPRSSIDVSVVVPIYNECALIEGILGTWAEGLKEQGLSFEFVVINDGSMDGTGRILDRVRSEMKELRVIHQLNSGHSRAIRRGYELARGRYILQLDANGRYEFEDFPRMWEERGPGKMVVAHRTHRLDSFFRRGFSAFLKSICYRLFGLILNDPNAPLRLFDRERIVPFLKSLPPDWTAVNLSLSIICKSNWPDSIVEVKIPFRKRLKGETRTTLSDLMGLASRHLREMIQLKYRILRNLPFSSQTPSLQPVESAL